MLASVFHVGSYFSSAMGKQKQGPPDPFPKHGLPRQSYGASLHCFHPPPLCSPQTLRDHIRTSFSKEENWVCIFFPGEKMKGEISNEKHCSHCAEASGSAMNFPMRSNIMKLCFQILY